VVGKCANPECGVPFRYFREGKLFRFDLNAPSTLVRVQSDAETHRRIEDFWLCGSCASKMTLISEDGVGVTTCPIPLPHSRYRSRPPDIPARAILGKRQVRDGNLST
jgi:hypothetical protein